MEKQLSRKEEFALYKEAQTLCEKDADVYQKRMEREQGSKEQQLDFRWIRSVLYKGTLADKIAASTLLIQDNPSSNISCLEKMIDWVSPKSKREALMSMDALKDLFIGDLLKDRKLRPFAQLAVDLDSLEFTERKRTLVEAYFEDKLRQMYADFIQRVEQFTHDADSTTKTKSIKILFELLISCPEQEQFLLEKLVNKLGDPDQKSATQVVHLLGKLTNEHHPAMKQVIVKEVERLLYRPNIAPKAQHNALSYLAAIRYVRGESEVANRCMNAYLSFFKACVKKEKVNSKMMSVLLAGIARAHPFSQLATAELQEKLDTIYKIAHIVNFNIAIQAYQVIFKVISKDNTGYLGDRYYCAIYRSLWQPELEACSRKALYLNLIYRTIKCDSVDKRIFAFLKRLLQICMHHPANLAGSIIMLISSVFKDKTQIRKNFITSFNCKALPNALLLEDDEEEHYEDAPEDVEEEKKEKKKSKSKKSKNHIEEKQPEKSKAAGSWVHAKNQIHEKNKLHYDSNHRNPIYANADLSRPYELCLLRNHYHPTVSLFTEQIIDQKGVDYDGDALYDFNVKSFLDKFVYKNPKKLSKAEKMAANERSLFERDLRIAKNKIKINQPGYVSQPESRVPVEERFIYQFLKAKKEYNADDDALSVTSDDFDRVVLRNFEASFDADLCEDLRSNKNIRKSVEEDVDDDDIEDDDDFEVDFNDDPEYKNAFAEFANDLEAPPLDENAEGNGMIIDDGVSDQDDDEDDEQNEDTEQDIGKFKRKGRDENLMSLLASADEFAHLLEENEDDEQLANDELEDCQNVDDDEDDEDALDFDDDEEILNKRKNRSKARKEKDELNQKIQRFKQQKKQKVASTKGNSDGPKSKKSLKPRFGGKDFGNKKRSFSTNGGKKRQSSGGFKGFKKQRTN